MGRYQTAPIPPYSAQNHTVGLSNDRGEVATINMNNSGEPNETVIDEGRSFQVNSIFFLYLVQDHNNRKGVYNFIVLWIS